MADRTGTLPAAADCRAREHAVLARFQAKPSYAAYKALILHYSDCPACADGTNPCAAGTELAQARKAARRS